MGLVALSREQITKDVNPVSLLVERLVTLKKNFTLYT